jgi:hypothetical protein
MRNLVCFKTKYVYKNKEIIINEHDFKISFVE